MKINLKKIKKNLNKNKGFTLTIIFSIIVLIIAITMVLFPEATFEEKIETYNLYLETDLYLDESISAFENEIYVYEGLDKAYFESVKKDLYWLKEKNEEIYTTRNYEKLVAFNLFMEYLLTVNEVFSFDITEINKEEMISDALEIEFSSVNQIDLDDEELTNKVYIINGFIEEIEKDFFNELKNRIYSSTDINVKFAEAKKMFMFFYN